MPEEGIRWMNRSELLTFEEIEYVAHIFVELGITKIRLTGGEPTMRRDLPVLIKKLSSIQGIKDIGMTTNGFLLKEFAEELHKSGLKRINVSLDSLNPAKFNLMTRRNFFDKVIEGLEEVEKYPIRPIKINVVLIRGINDNEIMGFAELARAKPYIVRFIEFMPIGADDNWSNDKVITTQKIIDTIEKKYKLVPVISVGSRTPADRYRFEDGRGEIGFISSVSEPFCESCNRIRLTSDGKLRTCLFSLKETDLKDLIRSNKSKDEIKQTIVGAVLKKERGHLINQVDFIKPERTMSQIGG
jgi:cyclic pyranopterin phosphate synthase